MKSLQMTLRFVLWIAVCALGQYEVAAKAGGPLADHIPSADVARIAERETPFLALSGFAPLDILVHEGREAVRYYERLLG